MDPILCLFWISGWRLFGMLKINHHAQHVQPHLMPMILTVISSLWAYWSRNCHPGCPRYYGHGIFPEISEPGCQVVGDKLSMTFINLLWCYVNFHVMNVNFSQFITIKEKQKTYGPVWLLVRQIGSWSPLTFRFSRARGSTTSFIGTYWLCTQSIPIIFSIL